jgi:hypothetical protein
VARERYRITVTLHRPNLGRGGFQMAARFLGTKQAGRQAGTLRSLDRRVQVTWDHSTGIQYVEHTRSGSVVTKPDTVTWTFEWEGPTEGDDTVVFHLAANAANDDASEFGDFVVVRRLFAHAGGQAAPHDALPQLLTWRRASAHRLNPHGDISRGMIRCLVWLTPSRRPGV